MLLSLASLLLAPAFAETPDTADVPALVDAPDGPREGHYKAVTEIEIDGVTVEGQLIGPTIAIGSETRHPPHETQIKLRADFNDLTSESVDLVR